MTFKTFFFPAVLTGSLFISGCSLVPPKIGPDATVGWITKFYNSSEIKNLPSECLATLNPSPIASGKFVRVREPHGRHAVYVPAQVPSGLDVKIGDEVEIEPKRCHNGVIPEVKKVLK